MHRVKIHEVITFLETLAPKALQESYDNCGLLTGQPEWEVTGVLTTLDCTEQLINEAIARKCNLIVSHHPIIFKGLKKLTGQNYVERTVIKAIKNEIAIYAIHTNLDNVLSGVNGRIASRLGLKNCSTLVPRQPTIKDIGAGLMGELTVAEEPLAFLMRLKHVMNCACVRYTTLPEKPIKKVALCGGSGSFLLPYAMAAGADVYVSADFKYHEFFDADQKIMVADIGHYESEQFTKELLQEVLTEKFLTFAINFSTTPTNPISYL